MPHKPGIGSNHTLWTECGVTEVISSGNDALLAIPYNICVSWRKCLLCVASAGETKLSTHGDPDGEEREGPDQINENILSAPK